MTRVFRYRTVALIGPWRDTPQAAMQDAMKAKQAAQDGGRDFGLRWLVPGSIELGLKITS